MTDNLDGARYLQMIRGGVAVLNARRQQINDLNVFPIPDGDTGDNMYMTLEAGLSASGESLSDVASSAAKGMLMGPGATRASSCPVYSQASPRGWKAAGPQMPEPSAGRWSKA